MRRFANAAFLLMKSRNVFDLTSDDLWLALQEAHPELTAVSELRKTPRTTMMRDLRKDRRFVVKDRQVRLIKDT